MTFWTALFLGIPASALVAFPAYKKNSLSRSGAVSAVLLGALIAACGGFKSWSLMIAFFLLASLSGKLAKRHPRYPGEKEHSGPRNYKQVFANGGPAFLAAVVSLCLPGRPEPLFFTAVAFAEAAADTCASELGILSRRAPISVITLKTAEPGSSGAISVFGLVMSFLGALIIGVIFFLFDIKNIKLFFIIVMSGFIGAFIDSILGAIIQAKYCCRICGEIVEKPIHHRAAAKRIAGLGFCGNNMVNFLSGCIAVVIAALMIK